MIVLLVYVFLYFNDRRSLSEARAAVIEAQADSSALSNKIVRVSGLEETQERLSARIEMLDEVVEGRLFWVNLLETLSRALPDYTWLDRVDQDDMAFDQIRISGATYANSAITEYMRGLEASPQLRDVTLVGVTRTDRDDAEVQGFTLTAEFENFQSVVVETPPDTTETEGQ